MSVTELFSRFQQRLHAAGGETRLIKGLSQAARYIADHNSLKEKEIVVPPKFAQRPLWGEIIPLLEEQGISVREAREASEVADAPAGLSHAELAVAETGSVLLAENTLEARIVSMLTLTHFVLVHVSNLVPMLDQVGQRLQQLTQPGADQRRYISLVSGPSRTADIERTLTIGVQGPALLCVLIVNDEE